MAGLSAYGTIFAIGTTNSTGLIANLTGISGPSISADTIDVSSHDSADAYRTFVVGLIDGGEISLEGNLITAAAGNRIMTVINDRTTQACIVKFPNAVKWTFAGIPTGFETDAPHDGKIGFSASVKVSGKPTLA